MSSDIETHDILLKRVIDFLRREWMAQSVGLVCAGIFDGKNEIIATSITPAEGKWIHAERNAINQFLEKYGEPSPSAIVVTTLSPCVIQLNSRIGGPCTDLLKSKNLHLVHSGVLDTFQKDSLDIYKKNRISFSLTSEPWCRRVCEKLLNIFETHGNRVNFELFSIKRSISIKEVFT